MGNFKQDILRLEKRNREIMELLQILKNKPIRKKITCNEFLKLKGFKNRGLALNTLKYIDFDTDLFSEVDVDQLAFLIYFTFHPRKTYFDDNEFTKKQLREVSKIEDFNINDVNKEYCPFNSNTNWKEIKIRRIYPNLKGAELYIKIREEILIDYVKYLSRK